MVEKQQYDVILLPPDAIQRGWPFLPCQLLGEWRNCTELVKNPGRFRGVTFRAENGVIQTIECHPTEYTIGICLLGVPRAPTT